MILRRWAAVAAAIAVHASAASPVAFVADVSGSATIAGDGKVTFLAELEPGTRLFLGTGARVAVTFARSGSEFAAAGPGEFVVAAEELKAERGQAPQRREVAALANAATLQRAARSATASLRMRGVPGKSPAAMRSDALEYPVETRVATLRPALRWRAEGAAQDAKVSVRDEEGREIWSGKASASGAVPAVELSAATRYTWTVMTPRGRLGEARFETLAPEALARVQRSQAGARSFSQRVMHALLLQDVGAEQDARHAWGELARERPDLPELARLAQAAIGSAAP